MKMILKYFAQRYEGDWEQIYKALEQRERVAPEALKDFKPQDSVCILDHEYPSLLKNIYKPPFVLFKYGDIGLARRELIAFAGNVRLTDGDLKALKEHEVSVVLLYDPKLAPAIAQLVANEIGVIAINAPVGSAPLVLNELPAYDHEKTPPAHPARIVAGMAHSIIVGETEADSENIVTEFGLNEARNIYLYAERINPLMERLVESHHAERITLLAYPTVGARKS